MSRRSSNDGVTTTSYAMLGMLAIRPWTTYELAKHMDRGLGRLWPRARSHLFNEPKNLQPYEPRGPRTYALAVESAIARERLPRAIGQVGIHGLYSRSR